MEYLWFIIAGLIFINFLQWNKIIKIEKKWSPDKDWYKNEIPRDLKENFIRNLDYYLDEKNIDTQEFFEYFNENEKEIELVVESIFEKTSVSKLYLPSQSFCYLINDKKNYRYNIGRQLQLFQIIDSLPDLLEDYAYDFDTLSEYQIFEILEALELKENIKQYPQKRINVLLKKEGKVYFSTTRWWDLGEHHEWWQFSLNQDLSDLETREIWLDPGEILLLPKKI